MTHPIKPNGYTTVSPYLICQRAEDVIQFLVRVLDAKELRRFPAPDGAIMHAEVKIEDTVVMIGSAGEQWPSIPTHLHVYVADVDATYQRALDAGAQSVREPAQQAGDGDRRGGVKDPGGNTWWFATIIEP